MSVGNVPIEIDLCTHNKTLVIGSNGSGKSSTLLDAIVFSLYGTAYRNINKSQLINTINESNLVVTINFSIGNNNYKVVRGLQPAIFEIRVNDVKLNELSSIKEQQRYLEETILKIDYLTFSNIAILGSANYIPFMDQPLATRRTLIEELLDINLFAQMLGIAKDSSRELVDNIKEVQQEIKSTKDQIVLVENFIDTMTKSSVVVDNTEHIKELVERQSELENESLKISESINFYKGQLESIKNPQADITKIQGFIADYTSQAKAETKKVKFYQSNSTCPTCTQNIDEDFKSNAIKDSLKFLNTVKDKIEKGDSIIENKTKIVKIIKTTQNNINELEYEFKNIYRSIVDVRKQYSALLVASTTQKPKDTLEIANYQIKLEQLIKNTKELYSKLELLTVDKSNYNLVVKLLSDSGIKSKILEKYLPYFNSYINNYLSIFGLDFNFSFNSTFKEIVKSRNRYGFTYNSFSEGEKMKISLAIMLAFRDLASLKSTNSTNLLIMDEIFDSSLDFDSNQNLMTIINGMVDNNIFIISHRNDINTEDFDRVMKFSKCKEFTKIDYI